MLLGACSLLRAIVPSPGSLTVPPTHRCRSYEKYGVVREGGQVVYREWAPGAAEAQLIGDFNGWQPQAMERDDFGTWTIRWVPAASPACTPLLRRWCAG